MKKTYFLLLPILISFCSNAQMITTFAGNGSATYGGDGGAATSASIYGPSGLAFDTVGNTYVTAYYSNNIRKISPSGIVSTIAGTGIAGYGGDGGPANAAQLNNPTKIVIDKAGNLYVSDFYNSRIRIISPAGIINTFAGNGSPGYSGDGGPATSAQLYDPAGLAIDDTGNIYISDVENYRIRKVSTSGIITTIAGTGIPGSLGDGGPASSAEINYVWGIKVDATGNIYLADHLNQKIRKISTTGIITTIAGTGGTGYSGDGGLAIAAQLNNPADIDIDSSGNIYIDDQLNYRVRKIDTSGIISTVAGTGVAGFGGDGGLATLSEINASNDLKFSPSGNLFICDNDNNRVRMITQYETSVPMTFSENLVKVYPNPTHDQVTVQLNGNYGLTNIQLIDEIGQLMVNLNTISHEANLDLNNFAKGLYILRIQSDNNVIVKKIIVE